MSLMLWSMFINMRTTSLSRYESKIFRFMVILYNPRNQYNLSRIFLRSNNSPVIKQLFCCYLSSSMVTSLNASLRSIHFCMYDTILRNFLFFVEAQLRSQYLIVHLNNSNFHARIYISENSCNFKHQFRFYRNYC